jgi:hypothetical protein
MEICRKCSRRLSLPLLLVIDGEVHTMCFHCASKEMDGKKYDYRPLGPEKKPSIRYAEL